MARLPTFNKLISDLKIPSERLATFNIERHFENAPATSGDFFKLIIDKSAETICRRSINQWLDEYGEAIEINQQAYSLDMRACNFLLHHRLALLY